MVPSYIRASARYSSISLGTSSRASPAPPESPPSEPSEPSEPSPPSPPSPPPEQPASVPMVSAAPVPARYRRLDRLSDITYRRRSSLTNPVIASDYRERSGPLSATSVPAIGAAPRVGFIALRPLAGRMREDALATRLVEHYEATADDPAIRLEEPYDADGREGVVDLFVRTRTTPSGPSWVGPSRALGISCVSRRRRPAPTTSRPTARCTAPSTPRDGRATCPRSAPSRS